MLILLPVYDEESWSDAIGLILLDIIAPISDPVFLILCEFCSERLLKGVSDLFLPDRGEASSKFLSIVDISYTDFFSGFCIEYETKTTR